MRFHVLFSCLIWFLANRNKGVIMACDNTEKSYAIDLNELKSRFRSYTNFGGHFPDSIAVSGDPARLSVRLPEGTTPDDSIARVLTDMLNRDMREVAFSTRDMGVGEKTWSAALADILAAPVIDHRADIASRYENVVESMKRRSSGFEL